MILKVITAIYASFFISAYALAAELTADDEDFLAEVVTAVEKKDIDWIVSHSVLPMATLNDEQERILNESEYRKIVTWLLSNNFGNTFKEKAKGDRFKNWKGVTIGRGELRFERVKMKESDPWTYRILSFGAVTFQPTTNKTNPPNQAAHTMPVSARHFHYGALDINLNRNGTSTEADIVWL